MSFFYLVFLGGGIGLGLLLIALLGVAEKRRPRFYEWIGGAFLGFAIGVLAAMVIGSLCAWGGCSIP